MTKSTVTTPTTALSIPETDEAATLATTLEVTSLETAAVACDAIRAFKALREHITERCEPVYRSAKDAYEAARELRDSFTARVDHAEETLRTKLKAWVATGETLPEGAVMRSQGWAHEVVDESLIPDEYWKLDEGKLRAAALAMRDKCNIPGVRVKKKPASLVILAEGPEVATK